MLSVGKRCFHFFLRKILFQNWHSIFHKAQKYTVEYKKDPVLFVVVKLYLYRSREIQTIVQCQGHFTVGHIFLPDMFPCNTTQTPEFL